MRCHLQISSYQIDLMSVNGPISPKQCYMKWTTRFIHFTGWIPLKYGSTTTPPIIAHCQKTLMSCLVFHIAIPKTSNIRRTPSFDLLTDEFSKRVSIIRRACINKQGSTQSVTCNDITRQIWEFAKSHNMWLSAAYCPGIENVEADEASEGC